MIPTPGSANISTLDFLLALDISTATPNIILTQASTGAHLNLCKWWVLITTPSGTPVHTGSLGTPDESGVWTTWQMPEAWPQPYNEVEWSGNSYKVTLFVDDGSGPYPTPGMQFSLQKTAVMCRPSGNTQGARNNFGVASFTTKVQCSTAKIFAQDSTSYLYKNSTGTLVSETWTLFYPPDSNGFQLTPTSIAGLPYAYFPISYNADGYVINLSTVMSYDQGNGVTITIAYKAQRKLNVQCSIDFCPLICAYQDLITKVQNGQCDGQNSVAFKDKLLIIGSKINIVLMAQSQGCSVEIPELLAEINKLGGFTCSTCADQTGGVFPTPSPSPTPSGGCCPVTLPVYIQGTSNAPVECPGSFFPADIFAADSTSFMGVAYSPDDMISLMNGNASWQALGTALPQGNCQVAFIKKPNVTDVPSVFVIGAIGSGKGSGVGSQVTAGQCVSGKQNYLAVITDKCNGAVITSLPVNMWVNYGTGPDISLGSITSMAALLTALNAEGGKPGSISYAIGTMPGALSILVTNTDCPELSNIISLKGDQFCPLVLDIIDLVTGIAPVGCATGAYLPTNVYGTTHTANIGSAADVMGIISIMNADAGWSALGSAYYFSSCKIGFNKLPSVGAVPYVGISSKSSTACVSNNQNYQVLVDDACLQTIPLTASGFPCNAQVDWGLGGGKVFLGNVANWTVLIAALNACATKPASLTFSPGTDPDSLNIYNSNCIAYTHVPIITCDAASNTFLLFGANHSSLTAAVPTANAVDAIAMNTSTVLGKVIGSLFAKHMWHTIRIANFLIVAEGDTGTIYFFDITNPLMPTLTRHIQLPDTGSGNCFTGNPHSITNQSGGVAVPSIYSLYFPTDYYAGMSLNKIYVTEGTTGSMWIVDLYNTVNAGVPYFYQNTFLLGKCPRVLVGNYLYFTQDGDLEQAAGLASTVLAGQCVIVDVTTTPFSMIEFRPFAVAAEYVWAASFDGNKHIYFTGALGRISTWNISTLVIDTEVPDVVGNAVNGGTTTYTFRLNSTYINDRLYLCPIGLAISGISTARLIYYLQASTLGGLNTVGHFNLPTPSILGSKTYNLVGLGNCLCIITAQGSVVGTGHLFVYTLDGAYIADMPLAAQQIYNIIPIKNITSYTPNTFF